MYICLSVCHPHLVKLCVKILEFALQSGPTIFGRFLFCHDVLKTLNINLDQISDEQR